MLESLQYRSSNGREIVYADVITPPEGMVPQGIVQIIHGMCEHIGRYHEFMQYLAEHGFVVCGHDQIGHGRSAAVNGTGYFAPKDGWDCLVRDARQTYHPDPGPVPQSAGVSARTQYGQFCSKGIYHPV